MSITLELPADMDSKLRARASRRGMTPEDYLRTIALDRLRPRRSSYQSLSAEEQETIAKLNGELTRDFWHRYKELERKIISGDFSEAERDEALELARQSEAWNVRRISAINEMAERRGMKWDALMRQLKMSHHPDAGEGQL